MSQTSLMVAATLPFKQWNIPGVVRPQPTRTGLEA